MNSSDTLDNTDGLVRDILAVIGPMLDGKPADSVLYVLAQISALVVSSLTGFGNKERLAALTIVQHTAEDILTVIEHVSPTPTSNLKGLN